MFHSKQEHFQIQTQRLNQEAALQARPGARCVIEFLPARLRVFAPARLR
jgi:hypothetical protein